MADQVATPRACLDGITFTPPAARMLAARTDDAPAGALQLRVRSEFREMPGLAITLAQASRLFGLPEPTCSSVLHELVDAGVLRMRHDCRYVLNVEAA